MINYLLIIITSICIYHAVKFIKLIKILNSNLKIFKQIIILLKDKTTSDLKKEKLILNYSKLLFINSLKVIIVAIVILSCLFFVNMFFTSLIEYILSIYGIILITVCIYIYHNILNAKL